jgi:hypothetical protein
MWSKDLPTQMAIPADVQAYVVTVVLRELQTLSGHPDRLHEWTRAAIEMAAKYA